MKFISFLSPRVLKYMSSCTLNACPLVLWMHVNLYCECMSAYTLNACLTWLTSVSYPNVVIYSGHKTVHRPMREKWLCMTLNGIDT